MSMLILIKTCILVFFFSLSIHATTFIPLPFEKQLESSDFLIEASLIDSESFKTVVGHVSTKYRFKIHKLFSEKELALNEIELVLPGGSIGGITTRVDGSPTFKQEHSVFLLIKTIEGRHYLSNFTLGKYEKVEIDGESYFVNEVFPSLKNIGKISETDFFELIKKRWSDEAHRPKVETVNFKKTGAPSSLSEKVARKTASKEDLNISENLIIYFLSIVGIFFCLYFLRGKNENK